MTIAEQIAAKLQKAAQSEQPMPIKVRGVATGREGIILGWYMPNHVAIVRWNNGNRQRVGIRNLEIL